MNFPALDSCCALVYFYTCTYNSTKHLFEFLRRFVDFFRFCLIFRPTVDVKSSAVKSATPTTAALKTTEATTTTAMAESKVVKSDGDVNCVNGDNNNGLNHDDNGVKSEVTSTPNDEITTTSVVQKTFEATIIEPTSS